MSQRPTLLKHLRKHRAITLLAVAAMWLQVVAFGLHLSTSARAAAGAAAGTSVAGEFFGIICTANGLAAMSLDGSEPAAATGNDCAVCALTALNDLGVNDQSQTCERPVHAITTLFWMPAHSEGMVSVSPRVGTSRAPPLL
nr:hypothetical protein [uncultured Cohaesibacter sp.]